MKLFATLCLNLLLFHCIAQSKQVTFTVDASRLEKPQNIFLRGDLPPLSWEKGYPLTDSNGDGVFEVNIEFNSAESKLEYKFTNANNWEFEGDDNRILWLKSAPKTIHHTFNEYNYYDAAALAMLSYNETQIKEDVAVLRKTIMYIHPNLYKYRDSTQLEQDFKALEAEMQAEPSLQNAYKAISLFASRIKCSHTFTNPWNQGADVKKAIFYQPDKIPFSFNRIGKRIFIDKNASEDPQLERGLEILSINGTPSQEIMAQLAAYITADGDNYEKRLQRLSLSGHEKFELFDIFYPLVFGSSDAFTLQLKNHLTGQIMETTVKATTKTARAAMLKARYEGFESTFESGWNFEILNDSILHLKLHSFSVYNTDFDWKGFLDGVFETLEAKKIAHFIIDIRYNEGGNDEVAKSILERIIRQPIDIARAISITAYRKIPDELRSYISTWDKNPYDWGNNVEEMGNGKYRMKNKTAQQRMVPKNGGFKGKSYLLTNADNSSATHIMAAYVKKYKLATIVGQETGGNQKGLNGGYMFFHRLPHTGVELDIPVLGVNISPDTPTTYNGGILPDIPVEKNVADFIKNIDTELNAVLKYIADHP